MLDHCHKQERWEMQQPVHPLDDFQSKGETNPPCWGSTVTETQMLEEGVDVALQQKMCGQVRALLT